jgi:hypothetical protein
MQGFQELDVVKITKLAQPNRHFDGSEDVIGEPRVGDVGTIVCVLTGLQSENIMYIVECMHPSGHTVWLADFLPEELELVSA